jgi:hypothetical protein
MPRCTFIEVRNVNNHPWNIYRKSYGDKAFIARCLDIITSCNGPIQIVIESVDALKLREKMLEIL